MNINQFHAKKEIIGVLEKYGLVEYEPKFEYEFGEDGPTESQLSSAEQDYAERVEEWHKQVSEALCEMFPYVNDNNQPISQT